MNKQTAAVQALQAHYLALKDVHMRELFAEDAERFERFSLRAAGILLDYSKNRATEHTLDLLLDLAKAAGLPQKIADFFAGEPLNHTEHRSALHIALRNVSAHPMMSGGVDVMPAVRETLQRMEAFVQQVDAQGVITDVVNIGIGGSDLGPALVTQALTPYSRGRYDCHFVANVDGSHISDVLAKVNPKTTLFIVATKSFRTQETLYNAMTAKEWLIERLGEDAVARQFVAVTAKADLAQAFGIPAQQIFPIWDWVGGRFSVWSAIGLPVMMAIGPQHFSRFLQGAHTMDQHFQTAPLQKNMPVLMALLSIWYINFFHCANRAIIPYDYYLSRLPAYLQQAHMESNGKSVANDGSTVDYATSPVIFGTTGSNGQHAFHQLLHQGTQIVPVDFIVAMQSHNPLRHHHRHLVANCFSQSQALLLGNQECSHKRIPGNKPSNTIVYEKLTPEALGALLALYEHKIFVQGVLWEINSFDQWGVELGKQMAGKIVGDLEQETIQPEHDSSTQGLMKEYLQYNEASR